MPAPRRPRSGLRMPAAVASERVADAKTAADEFIARQKPRLRGVSPRVGLLRLPGRRRGAGGRRADPAGDAAVAIYAASLSALLGRERSLSPDQLAPPGDPPLDAAARPLDDLPVDRRHRDAVRRARPRRSPGERAPDRRLGWSRGGDRRRAGLGRGPEVGDGASSTSRSVGSAPSAFPGIVVNAGAGRRRPDRRRAALSTPRARSIYARQRPDPNPAVFGYHEIFHLLVIAAAAAHFAAVAIYALPAG